MRGYILHKKIAGFGVKAKEEVIDISEWSIEKIENWLKEHSPFPAPREKFINFKYNHND